VEYTDREDGPMDNAIIQVEDLVKVFGGKDPVRALDGLSLTVERGGIYGLLGPNGAGKTTLIRVLTTLLPPDAGSARVAGVDVRQHPERVRARIGLAGQYAAVDDHLTGRENVEMVGRLYGLPRRQARRRAGEVLERIGLTEAADRQVQTYSGGMRRRLDLAACLVGRPQVLFLDEPTAGLDPASRRDLWALIGDLVDAGTTVLLTTQYLEEADQLAHRIAVIDHGGLIGEGTPDQLKDRVGGAVLELTMPDDDRARARWALQTLQAEDPTDDRHPGRIVVPAPDGAGTLTQALRRLDGAGVTPQDVTLRKPTLDDVFLALTGHRATTPTGNGPHPRSSVDRRGPQQRERAIR
jgi:ABC-2 type transport system ATP-binding protein